MVYYGLIAAILFILAAIIIKKIQSSQKEDKKVFLPYNSYYCPKCKRFFPLAEAKSKPLACGRCGEKGIIKCVDKPKGQSGEKTP